MLQISRRTHDGAGKIGVPAGMGLGASTCRRMRLRLLHSTEGLPGAGQSQSQLLQLLLNLNVDLMII